MVNVVVTYKVIGATAAVENGVDWLEAGLNETVDELLRLVELAQIHKYTSSNFPALPGGSRYRRTFDLRDASQTERTGDKLPDISGVWSVDEGKARYGKFVLGTRQEQAPIHRGRWKSRDEVEQEIQEKVSEIVEEKLRR